MLEARDFCGGATGRNGGHLTPVSALWYSDLAASQVHLSRYLPAPPPGKTREEVWGNDRGAQTDETVRRMLTLEARTVAELLALTRGEMAMEKKRARVSKTQEHDIDPQLVMQGNWTLAFTQQEEQAYEDALERAKRAGLSDWAKHVRRVDLEEVRTVSTLQPALLLSAADTSGNRHSEHARCARRGVRQAPRSTLVASSRCSTTLPAAKQRRAALRSRCTRRVP